MYEDQPLGPTFGDMILVALNMQRNALSPHLKELQHD